MALLKGILLGIGGDPDRVDLTSFAPGPVTSGTRHWGVQINTDSFIRYGGNTGSGAPTFNQDAYNWLLSGSAGDYDVRVTNSVTPANATLGVLAPAADSLSTWLSLSSTRQWWYDNASAFAQNWSFTMEIRDATTLDVLESRPITLNAPTP